LGDGPPEFTQGSTCPALLGKSAGRSIPFAYRAFTFSGRRFHAVQLGIDFLTPWVLRNAPRPLPRPRRCSACGLLTQRRFGLFPVRSPLLRESLLLSFPGGTEMVHFPPLASPRLCVQRGDGRALPRPGCPIRKSPDQNPLAAPRGLSQLATSFFAVRCQGILRAPLVA
jgi:hypothetical protein